MNGKTPPRIAVLGSLASAALLLAFAAPPALAVGRPTEPGALTLIDAPQGRVRVLADKDGDPLHLRDGDNVDGWSPIGPGGNAAKARGGAAESPSAEQPPSAAEHPAAGPLALASAVIAAGAGGCGLVLLRRRRAQRRADSAQDDRS
ncbi:hypothetical protein QIS99_22595 [Streptomyces sp. B-S-A8]|uniref:Uncharacterized protein n=1 Tax=Streptomyces solicavernae TaxID=3043614 RepID=A0ABT6RWZ6_9ACTN|nr:hypothetical protein [Streptomyces sp. B-S-A8]MDI3388962.1 hypothetical protein [Streptomyces sp. B-S-A8]